MYNSTYVRYLEGVNFIDIESRMVVTRGQDKAGNAVGGAVRIILV